MTEGTRRALPALLAALLIVTILPADAASAPVVVDDGFTEQSLGARVEVLDDPGETLSIDDARSLSGSFQSTTSDVPSFGLTRSAYWLRIRVQDQRKDGGALRLEVPNALLDRVDLYLPGEDTPIRNGDGVPIAARPIAHRHPVFELRPARGRDEVHFLRVASTSSLQVPVRLWSAAAFDANVTRASRLLGVYAGLLGAVLLHTLGVALVRRSRSHVRFAAFVAALASFQASAEGLTQRLLWPASAWLADHAVVACAAFAGAAALGFAVDFLDLEVFAPRLGTLLRRAGQLSTILGVLSLALPVRAATNVFTVLAIAAAVAIACASAWRLRSEETPAMRRPLRMFTLGSCVLLAATGWYALRIRGVLPSDLRTLHWPHLGWGLVTATLAAALGDRTAVLRREAQA